MYEYRNLCCLWQDLSLRIRDLDATLSQMCFVILTCGTHNTHTHTHLCTLFRAVDVIRSVCGGAYFGVMFAAAFEISFTLDIYLKNYASMTSKQRFNND